MDANSGVDQGGSGRDVLGFAELRLDRITHEVRQRGGKPLSLTAREYELLLTLLEHPRQVLSRTQLAQRVWGTSYISSNFVAVAIRSLRQKLEANGEPRLIQTVRGYGYALREEPVFA
jgi:DNA-binding response OmpR family regulator